MVIDYTEHTRSTSDRRSEIYKCWIRIKGQHQIGDVKSTSVGPGFALQIHVFLQIVDKIDCFIISDDSL